MERETTDAEALDIKMIAEYMNSSTIKFTVKPVRFTPAEHGVHTDEERGLTYE